LNTQEPLRVGEVIEASTTSFTAQCYELYQIPPLGSLVKTGSPELELYAVVCSAATTSLEPGRRPIARGKDEESEDAIYKSSPQLGKLLRSEFGVLVVGHKVDHKIYHYLPPKPARIHGFVYLCPAEEVREFSQSLDFLSLLLGTSLPLPKDELISACLRQMSQVQEDSHRFLVVAGKELASRLSGDFSQLRAILERMRL
jgi:hypothetical protein